MKFLVLSGMLSLAGGRHALKGEQIEGSALAEAPEVYIEMGALRPVTDDGELPVVARVEVGLSGEAKEAIEAMQADIDGFKVELEELRAFKDAMTGEEIAEVEARVAEVKAQAEAKAKFEALNKTELQAMAKELGIEFTTRTTVQELREAILAKQ